MVRRPQPLSPPQRNSLMPPARGRYLIAAAVMVLGVATAMTPRLAHGSEDEAMQKVPGLVDAATLAPRISVKLKYSTKDNFLGADLYGDLERCYLQKECAAKLARASEALHALRPDLRLLVYDCARPTRVQRRMWRRVKGTRQQAYVADPAKGSMHGRGCAVDLTLADKQNSPLDMGTPFDHTGQLAQPRLERRLHLKGKLTAAQWANRLLLRQVMVATGFIPLAIEWWHFDCIRPGEARKRYPTIP